MSEYKLKRVAGVGWIYRGWRLMKYQEFPSSVPIWSVVSPDGSIKPYKFQARRDAIEYVDEVEDGTG